MGADNPARWADDPDHAELVRRWDGEQWTELRLPRRGAHAVSADRRGRLLDRAVADFGNDTRANRKAIAALGESLRDGEIPLASLAGQSSKERKAAPGLMLLTDQRVLFRGYRLGAAEEVDMELSSVDSITATTGVVFGGVNVTVPGEIFVLNDTTKSHARVFAENARHALDFIRDVPQTQASAATDDLVSKLERLADLHRSGALSDGEYADAKAALIAANS